MAHERVNVVFHRTKLNEVAVWYDRKAPSLDIVFIIDPTSMT